jgi:hypothetical protein
MPNDNPDPPIPNLAGADALKEPGEFSSHPAETSAMSHAKSRF